MLNISSFQKNCRHRWNVGNFLEADKESAYSPRKKGDWIPYESYMRAQIVKGGEEGEVAVLIVEFPSNGSEDNAHHCHPKSDRRITVIDGNGVFEFLQGRELFQIPLEKGNRVWMPRGILHTFRAGNKGMLVESIHSPFIPIENPYCLVYPKRKRK